MESPDLLTRIVVLIAFFTESFPTFNLVFVAQSQDLVGILTVLT